MQPYSECHGLSKPSEAQDRLRVLQVSVLSCQSKQRCSEVARRRSHVPLQAPCFAVPAATADERKQGKAASDAAEQTRHFPGSARPTSYGDRKSTRLNS